MVWFVSFWCCLKFLAVTLLSTQAKRVGKRTCAFLLKTWLSGVWQRAPQNLAVRCLAKEGVPVVALGHVYEQAYLSLECQCSCYYPKASNLFMQPRLCTTACGQYQCVCVVNSFSFIWGIGLETLHIIRA